MDRIDRQITTKYKLRDAVNVTKFDDEVRAGSGTSADASVHNVFWKGALREHLHHGTAEFQLRAIVAEPGVLADFGVHRLDAAVDAIRTNQFKIHGIRAGSHTA